MPGHMNVLLAEADVPYESLDDLDAANAKFSSTDVALVVGANDVVNPAARDDPASPLYGMPILNADQAAHVVFMKRSMRPGLLGRRQRPALRPPHRAALRRRQGLPDQARRRGPGRLTHLISRPAVSGPGWPCAMLCADVVVPKRCVAARRHGRTGGRLRPGGGRALRRGDRAGRRLRPDLQLRLNRPPRPSDLRPAKRALPERAAPPRRRPPSRPAPPRRRRPEGAVRAVVDHRRPARHGLLLGAGPGSDSVGRRHQRLPGGNQPLPSSNSTRTPSSPHRSQAGRGSGGPAGRPPCSIKAQAAQAAYHSLDAAVKQAVLLLYIRGSGGGDGQPGRGQLAGLRRRLRRHRHHPQRPTRHSRLRRRKAKQDLGCGPKGPGCRRMQATGDGGPGPGGSEPGGPTTGRRADVHQRLGRRRRSNRATPSWRPRPATSCSRPLRCSSARRAPSRPRCRPRRWRWRGRSPSWVSPTCGAPPARTRSIAPA